MYQITQSVGYDVSSYQDSFQPDIGGELGKSLNLNDNTITYWDGYQWVYFKDLPDSLKVEYMENMLRLV